MLQLENILLSDIYTFYRIFLQDLIFHWSPEWHSKTPILGLNFL